MRKFSLNQLRISSMPTKLKGLLSVNYYYLAIASALILVTLLLPRTGQLYNADLIHPASFIVDQRNDVDLSTWNWSPNNYFFPELTFYWVMNSLFKWISPIDIHTSYLIFGSLIFVFAVYIASSRIFNFDRKAAQSRLAFPGIVFATVYLDHLLPKLGFSYFLLPWIHSGCYVGCLLALAIVIHLQIHQSTESKLQKTLLGLLTFLLCASNNFFVLWFVIPMFLTLLHQQSRNDISKKLFVRLSFIILGSGILGYLVHRLTSPAKTKLKLEAILPSLEKFGAVLLQNVDIMAFMIIWLVISLMGLFMSLRESAPADSKALQISQKTFWLWNFYSFIVTFFLVHLYGLFYDVGNFRYFYPLIYNPIVLLAWLTVKASRQIENRFGTASIRELSRSFLIISLIFALLSFPHIFSFYKNTRGYKLYECLRNDGVGVVYSEYWTSKPVYVFSDGRIIPRQLTDRGKQRHHSNNRAWYTLKPAEPYAIALMQDTSFGREKFPEYESKTCSGVAYKLLPSLLERRIANQVRRRRQ